MDDIRKGRANNVLEHVESHLTQLSIKDDLIDCPCTFLDILFQTMLCQLLRLCCKMFCETEWINEKTPDIQNRAVKNGQK